MDPLLTGVNVPLPGGLPLNGKGVIGDGLGDVGGDRSKLLTRHETLLTKVSTEVLLDHVEISRSADDGRREGDFFFQNLKRRRGEQKVVRISLDRSSMDRADMSSI
jgi:hypothetical protein